MTKINHLGKRIKSLYDREMHTNRGPYGKRNGYTLLYLKDDAAGRTRVVRSAFNKLIRISIYTRTGVYQLPTFYRDRETRI